MPAEIVDEDEDKGPEGVVIIWIMSVQYWQHIDHPHNMSQDAEDYKYQLEDTGSEKFKMVYSLKCCSQGCKEQ